MSKYVMPTILGVAVIAMFGLFFIGKDSGSVNAAIEGVKEFANLSSKHVNEEVSYPQTPPVGGDHNPRWAQCDGKVFDEPIKNVNAVHSLEHGAAWITYKPGLTAADIESLAKKVDGVQYTMMSPVESQDAPITLTSWGAQLNLQSAGDAKIDQFLTKYRQGVNTPEKGASCSVAAGM